MQTAYRARDFQTLVRKLYLAETGKTHRQLTLAERQAVQLRFNITRDRDGWFVARPFAEAA